MKTLTTHRLFNYFILCSTQENNVSSEDLSLSYAEYEEFISDFSRQQMSISERLHCLLHAKLELYSLKKLSPITGHSRSIMAEFYLDKCLALIEVEIELVNFNVQYPQSGEIPPSLSSSLHWKGTLVNLMELISSLDYSELVTDENGRRFSFAGIVSTFEKFFNVSIPKPYDLRADLSRRKKGYSVLLPKLKEAYERNIVNCGIGK